MLRHGEDKPSGSLWTSESHPTWLSGFVASDSKSASAAWLPPNSEATALRSELARLFNLPASESASSTSADWPAESHSLPETDVVETDALEAEVLETDASSAPAHSDDAEFVAEQAADELNSGVSEATAATTSDEPLSYSDDENVEQSVTRYMQNLIARTRGWGEPVDGAQSQQSQSTAEPTTAMRDSECVRESESPSANARPIGTDTPAVNTDRQQPLMVTPPAQSMGPVHRQDKESLRAATEHMRHVANLQTRNNVEVSNWSRLKSSIKTKSALATSAFVLSLGLVLLGYRGKPELIVLGGCTACIGVLTWLDLLMAMHKARAETKRLSAEERR